MKRMIERAGYDCDCASDGDEALAMAASTAYSLVLMDCMLGGRMDGWLTASKIRELNPDLMIVAVTGLTKSKDLEDKCYGAGMNDIAVKPLNRETLNGWLKRMQSKMRD